MSRVWQVLVGQPYATRPQRENPAKRSLCVNYGDIGSQTRGIPKTPISTFKIAESDTVDMEPSEENTMRERSRPAIPRRSVGSISCLPIQALTRQSTVRSVSCPKGQFMGHIGVHLHNRRLEAKTADCRLDVGEDRRAPIVPPPG